MVKRIIKSVMAGFIAMLALLPTGASAQWSGSNGQIFFEYTVGEVQSIAAANPDMSESHIVVQGTAEVTVGDVAVSADGTKIVYESRNGSTNVYSIVIANADGSSPVTLQSVTAPQVVQNPTFSPDGATVFYALNGNSTATANGIFSVPATGGSPTQLVAGVSGTYDASESLVASSVTNKIYFERSSGGTNGIASANFNGSGVAIVYNSGSTSIVVEDITPDGSKLLFSRFNASNKKELYSVDVATGTTVLAVAALDPDSARGASYSPDGTKLIYLRQSFSGNTYTNVGARIVNADGSGTAVAFRQDAANLVWSTTALATAGTYPTPLALGTVTNQNQLGAAPTPGLPNAGDIIANWPIALLALTLLTAIGFETARRVRRRA